MSKSENIWLVDWTDLISYIYVASDTRTYAALSTPVLVSRSASERTRQETEEFSLSRKLLELSTSLSTGVSTTGNVCSEGSLQETCIEELSALQLERVCTVEVSKYPELQFSRGYTLDNNKQILIVTQRHLAYHLPFGTLAL